MNLADLETLIHSHLDGRITADEMEQLSQELEADARSRRVYLRLAHLHDIGENQEGRHRCLAQRHPYLMRTDSK